MTFQYPDQNQANDAEEPLDGQSIDGHEKPAKRQFSKKQKAQIAVAIAGIFALSAGGLAYLKGGLFQPAPSTEMEEMVRRADSAAAAQVSPKAAGEVGVTQEMITAANAKQPENASGQMAAPVPVAAPVVADQPAPAPAPVVTPAPAPVVAAIKQEVAVVSPLEVAPVAKIKTNWIIDRLEARIELKKRELAALEAKAVKAREDFALLAAQAPAGSPATELVAKPKSTPTPRENLRADRVVAVLVDGVVLDNNDVIDLGAYSKQLNGRLRSVDAVAGKFMINKEEFHVGG